MKEHTLTSQEATVSFVGEEIGRSDSRANAHSHVGDYASTDRRQGKCSGCRWSETVLYRKDNGNYVAFTAGRSIVPGETDYIKIMETASATALVDLLTVRGKESPYLPVPSARALAQAANDDDDIFDAFNNRAVI